MGEVVLVARNATTGADDAGAISVAHFGAVGDGVADDSTPLRNAVEAAAGGVLRLAPNKTYRFTETNNPLTPASRTVIDLNGSTITCPAVANQSNRIFNIHDVSDVEIRGGKLQGSTTLTGTQTDYTDALGIHIQNAQRIRLIDVETSYFWWDGIIIYGGSGACADIVLDRVNSHHNRRSGMSVLQCARLTVRDSRFDSNGSGQDPKSGIDIETEGSGSPVVSDVLIDGCSFTGNVQGFICQQNASAGGGRPVDVTVRNCAFTGNTLRGVNLISVDGALVQGCKVSGASQAISSGEGGTAIGASDCTSLTISSNRIRDCCRGILAVRSSGVEISGNVLAGRGSVASAVENDGILVTYTAGYPGHRARIVANDVEAFGGNGITVANICGATIANNNVRDNYRYGISVQGCLSSQVVNNTVTGSGRATNLTFYDIVVYAGSDACMVANNVCKYHDRHFTGTLTAGASTSCTLATGIPTMSDGYLVGAPIVITSGTGSGSSALISAHASSTRVLTTSAFQPTAPAASSGYEIRWPNKVYAAISVAAGSTKVYVLDNDISKGGAVDDAGTGTVTRAI